MAISEVCKFEVKDEIDRYVQDDGISRNEASKKLAAFFSEILEKEIKPGTIRQKDLRARKELVATNVAKPTGPTFNKVNEKIDWAKWSWDPVTGCEQNCLYCPEEDIARRFPKNFPKGFKPDFHADRLTAPKNTIIPEQRKKEKGIDKVLVCSMGDLFGDWVKDVWINKVLKACKENPEWTYIFLTKNPKRYLKFKFPEHSWLGAAGDITSRAKEAQKVLSKIKTNITFLSCEPLNHNVRLIDGAVDWVIIGGQSKTSQIKASQPKLSWIADLLNDAEKNRIKVYFKPNLTIIKEYPMGVLAQVIK